MKLADSQGWFIFQEGHHRGPFSLKEMQKFLKIGTVQERTKIWRHGQNHWRSLSQYEEFKKVVRKMPLSGFDSPPPVNKTMFDGQVDTYPRLEDIIATSLLPEQKQELKRELKKELKKEIKGEIKPELSPQIRKEVKQRKNDLQQELEHKVSQVVSETVKGQRKFIKNQLKTELKKELKVEITPELGPQIQNEILNQRDEIKHELKAELAPRIHAEVLDLRKKTEGQFKDQIVDTVVSIDQKLDKTIKKIDGQISESVNQLSKQLKRDDHQLSKSVSELSEQLNRNIDSPPPLPFAVREENLKPSFERPSFETERKPQQKRFSPEKKRSLKRSFATSLIALPLAFAMIYYFIYLPTLEFNRPLDMPDKLFTQFEEITGQDIILGVKRVAAFSYSGEKVFFASNVGGEGHYQLTIKSVPGKVLSTEPIKAVAKASYQNKLASFSRFTMIEGAKFLPGDYEVTISAEKFDWSKKLWDLFLKEPVKAPALKTVITWKGKDPKKYETQIKKFLNKIESNRELVLEEVKQKYQTQIELLNLIKEKLTYSLTKRNSKKVFKNFYMREIGPILSSISLKNREAMAKVNLKNPEFYDKFETQLNFGKDIGVLATDIIGNLRTKKLRGKNELMGRLVKLKEKIYLQTYKKAGGK